MRRGEPPPRVRKEAYDLVAYVPPNKGGRPIARLPCCCCMTSFENEEWSIRIRKKLLSRRSKNDSGTLTSMLYRAHRGLPGTTHMDPEFSIKLTGMRMSATTRHAADLTGKCSIVPTSTIIGSC